MKFLKFRSVLTESGRVLRKLDKRNVVRIRRRLKQLGKMAESGDRDWRDVVNCYNSWKAHAEQGNSYRTIRRIKECLTQS